MLAKLGYRANAVFNELEALQAARKIRMHEQEEGRSRVPKLPDGFAKMRAASMMIVRVFSSTVGPPSWLFRPLLSRHRG
jgi:hypothetical protein